jgi:glycosyltransferase involved in cell wall biosynthesis
LIVGGAQENTVSSVLGLHAKTDVQVDLISGPTNGPEGSLESVFKNSPELLSVIPSLVRPVDPLNDWRALQELKAVFRKTRPEIVHTHSGKAGILGRLAAHQAGVPVIIHTIHGPSFGAFQGTLANLAFSAAERYAAKYTTHFISVANAMTQQYLAAGIGVPEQYTRIFSGFDLQPFLDAKNDPALREKFEISPDDIVVGKIARLFELKGHDDLFAIAPKLVAQFPKIKFLFVGDGPWRARFEAMAQSLGLKNHFILTGLVPPRDVAKYVGIMDALVHLSRREGLPRALPQALAAAKPVIAYDCDGANEVCFENETGFLISPGDFGALEKRLLQVANDPVLRERLGKTGQNFVRERFPVQKMVDEIYALYLRLLAKKSA